MRRLLGKTARVSPRRSLRAWTERRADRGRRFAASDLAAAKESKMANFLLLMSPEVPRVVWRVELNLKSQS